MKIRVDRGSGINFSEGAMTVALAWYSHHYRAWKIARARRRAYREIALLPESLQMDLTTRHQEM